jgi:hypothetical protein
MANPKFYCYTDSGAPTANKVDPFWLIKILDACLITGYGTHSAAGWTAPYTGTAGTTDGVISGYNMWGNASTGGYGSIRPTTSTTVNAPGTADYTMECWARWDTTHKGNNFIFNFNVNSGSQHGIYSDTINLDFLEGGTARARVAISTIPVNTWHHLAISRVSGVSRFFINGTQAGTSYTASTNLTYCVPQIGGHSFIDTNSDSSYIFGGQLCDVRYVSGTGLYTTAFTTPTAALSAIAGTKLLVNGTGEHRSMVFTDSSTVGLALSNGSMYVTNRVARPYATSDPATTDYRVYANSLGRALMVEAHQRSKSYVDAYNTATSVNSGTGRFLTKIIETGTNKPFWSRYPTTWSDISNNKWYLAATDEFFYLAIDMQPDTTAYLNTSTGSFHSSLFSGSYIDSPELIQLHSFGTLSDLETTGVDSVFSYDLLDAGTAMYYATARFSGLTSIIYNNSTNANGMAHNSLSDNTKAIAGINIFKLPPFVHASSFNTGFINIIPYHGKAILQVADENTSTTFMTKVPIGMRLNGNDYCSTVIGKLPGLYNLSGLEGENVSHWSSVNITTREGTNLRLRAVRVFVTNTSFLLYINEGAW